MTRDEAFALFARWNIRRVNDPAEYERGVDLIAGLMLPRIEADELYFYLMDWLTGA